MNLHVFRSEEELAKAGAGIIAAQILAKPDCVLGLATGSSPLGIYQSLIELYKEGIISFKEVTTFNLDEYLGLEPSHAESYHYYMAENLFDYVDQPDELRHIPRGDVADPEAEGRAYDALIEEAGGIDLQLLGIGQNGHIGFNEPDNVFAGGTHVVDLTESTIEANSRFFDSADEVPRQAVSMGIRSIMQAKRILLIATGEGKANAIQRTIEGPIDPRCPASILQVHQDATILVDRAAASKLHLD